jgi:hypothetical protein
MMEILQILKFSFKGERLDFNDGWITRELDEISVIDVPPSTIHELLATGQVEELTRLLCQEKS